MRRRLLVAGGIAVAVALVLIIYHLALSGSGTAGRPGNTRPTSVIGSGPRALGVSAAGVILSGHPPSGASLPRLPTDKPPQGGRLRGPLLEQARVLGAAPPVLRSCIAASRYGETGVEVKLVSGIELRFGRAARAAQKWAAAAAILADPAVSEIGYVDLYSPGRASTGGSGVTLPPAERGASTHCGH